jgi:hypothetical protein
MSCGIAEKRTSPTYIVRSRNLLDDVFIEVSK